MESGHCGNCSHPLSATDSICPSCGAAVRKTELGPVDGVDARDNDLSARTGPLRAIGEAARLIRRQPSILLIAVQALIVEGVWLGLASLYGGSGGDGAAVALLYLIGGTAAFLYASAGIWGGLVSVAGGSFRWQRFWLHGFLYLGRTITVLVIACLMFLPAFIASIVMIIGATASASFPSSHPYGAPAAPGSYMPYLLLITCIVWVLNFLWASQRLVVTAPAIAASGGERGPVTERIQRERSWEVTGLWLALLALGGIVAILSAALGLLFAVGGIVAELHYLFAMFGIGGTSPFSPFGGAAAPKTIPNLSQLLGAAGPNAPGGGLSVPAPTPPTAFLVVSVGSAFANGALYYLFQTFAGLAALVYYRSAGGSSAWFPLDMAKPPPAGEPRVTPPPFPAREAAPPPEPSTATRELFTARVARHRARLGSVFHSIAASASRPGAARAEHSAVSDAPMTGNLAAQWAQRRPDFHKIARVAIQTVTAMIGELPDFRPLLRGKIFPHLPELFAAPEHAAAGWPSGVASRAAAAIPVAAFTLLELGVMIGWGYSFGDCLLGAVIGFAFGVAALRIGAAAERLMIARMIQVEISQEAAEMDIAAASTGLLLAAAFALLIAIVLRASGTQSLTTTSVLNGLSVGTLFPAATRLISARRLVGWPAVSAAAVFTVSILCAWMFLLWLVGSAL